MLWLLQILAFGHVHKWKEIDRQKLTVVTKMGSHKDDLTSVGQRVFTVCEKCGAQKKWDLV